MDAWKSLVKTALLGTGNGFTPPVVSGLLQDTLNLIPRDDQDTAFFSTAALIGLASLAGTIPNKLEETGAASPAESLNMISGEASVFLKRILGGEHEQVLPEFLVLTASQNRIVPPETLPALLGLGKHKLRKLVLPVTGERGKWLASQNLAWSYALGREDADDVWETGTRMERVQLLERLRDYHAKRAIELIQSTWAQDPHEERAAFVAALSNGLNMDDEPFLESCLDDSRKEVREAALDLLIRLPESRHSKRMIARLEPFAEYKSPMLGKDSLRVSLPEGVDAAAKRDGISGATLHKKLGKQANVLVQMIALAPPSVWSQKWKQAPERILQAALRSEWKDALILGWSLAAERSRDSDWAAAIADVVVKQTDGREIAREIDLRGLIKLIPVEKLEALAKASIVKTIKELDDAHPMLGLLEAYEVQWSEPLARTVMASMQRQAGKGHWRLMRTLPSFGLRIPVSLTETFLKGWPDDSKGWETWLDQFCAVLRFRRDMTDALRR
ncbi:MAG TPA: DUF5691 domain-containing protein [Anaerolineales bacterium]|nr:DUF5691 domain-containing protein [Anaerolineales bacterium]